MHRWGRHALYLSHLRSGYGSQQEGSIPANSNLIFNTVVLNIISAQALVDNGTEWVPVTDGESSPSTANGTSFGTVTSTPGPTITHTFAITSTGGDLSFLVGDPQVSIQGSSAFTVSQLSINTDNTGGTFTVTYTPTNNVSTAIVTINNVFSAPPVSYQSIALLCRRKVRLQTMEPPSSWPAPMTSPDTPSTRLIHL